METSSTANALSLFTSIKSGIDDDTSHSRIANGYHMDDQRSRQTPSGKIACNVEWRPSETSVWPSRRSYPKSRRKPRRTRGAENLRRSPGPCTYNRLERLCGLSLGKRRLPKGKHCITTAVSTRLIRRKYRPLSRCMLLSAARSSINLLGKRTDFRVLNSTGHTFPFINRCRPIYERLARSDTDD